MCASPGDLHSLPGCGSFFGAFLSHSAYLEFLIESFPQCPVLWALPGERASPVCGQQARVVLGWSPSDGFLARNFLGLCPFPKGRAFSQPYFSCRITLRRSQTLGPREDGPLTTSFPVLGFSSAFE